MQHSDEFKKHRIFVIQTVCKIHFVSVHSYFENIVQLFENILKTGNICLHKQEGLLHHHYPMELVMRRFADDINEKSPDTKPKIFKAINRFVSCRGFCMSRFEDYRRSYNTGVPLFQNVIPF